MHMNMLPFKAGPSLDNKGAFHAILSAKADPATYATLAAFLLAALLLAPSYRPSPGPSRLENRLGDAPSPNAPLVFQLSFTASALTTAFYISLAVSGIYAIPLRVPVPKSQSSPANLTPELLLAAATTPMA
jgi:hypothetical protein